MNPQLHPSGNRIACYWMPSAADPYTVVYLDHPDGRQPNKFQAVGMNHRPFHPQGICQHLACEDGPHLGQPILFSSLPADCQKLVNHDLATT